MISKNYSGLFLFLFCILSYLYDLGFQLALYTHPGVSSAYSRFPVCHLTLLTQDQSILPLPFIYLIIINYMNTGLYEVELHCHPWSEQDLQLTFKQARALKSWKNLIIKCAQQGQHLVPIWFGLWFKCEVCPV